MRTFNQHEYNQQYYQDHKEDIKAHIREVRLRDVEANRAYGRKMAKRHKVTSNLRARLWYQEHKQLMIDRAKVWKANNKEKVQINTRAYTSRRNNAIGQFSTKDFLKLKHNLLNLCGYCGINQADTIDHVIPLSRGGSNYIGNIMPACGKCNYSKQCKTIIEWRYNKPVCTRNV
jgi:5-methylcytosine-specific restriction endonuclease McrA